jgi:hypothetical protein
MNNDVLLALAQMGLALAGFSGIIAAVQGDPAKWSLQQSLALRLLLECCFLVLFLSMIPLVLNQLLSPIVAARAAALLMAIAIFSWIASALIRLRQTKIQPRRPRLLAFMITILLAFDAGAFCAAAGLLQGAVVYVGALIWLLLFATTQFFTSLQSLRGDVS